MRLTKVCCVQWDHHKLHKAGLPSRRDPAHRQDTLAGRILICYLLSKSERICNKIHSGIWRHVVSGKAFTVVSAGNSGQFMTLSCDDHIGFAFLSWLLAIVDDFTAAILPVEGCLSCLQLVCIQQLHRRQLSTCTHMPQYMDWRAGCPQKVYFPREALA